MLTARLAAMFPPMIALTLPPVLPLLLLFPPILLAMLPIKPGHTAASTARASAPRDSGLGERPLRGSGSASRRLRRGDSTVDNCTFMLSRAIFSRNFCGFFCDFFCDFVQRRGHLRIESALLRIY